MPHLKLAGPTRQLAGVVTGGAKGRVRESQGRARPKREVSLRPVIGRRGMVEGCGGE